MNRRKSGTINNSCVECGAPIRRHAVLCNSCAVVAETEFAETVWDAIKGEPRGFSNIRRIA